MKSIITLYKNIPLINGNYIIEDIESYLNQYESLSIKKEIDFIIINQFNDVLLNFEINQLENLKIYNYVKIEGSDNYLTAYYFITNIEKAANNNLKFTLELDVLNTYQNLEFYNNTFVEREHIDRWNYQGFYYDKELNKIFLLRNFIKDQDEKQPLMLIDSFNCYTDTSDILLNNNYWIKINTKDETDNKEGIKIYFMNLFYDFYLAAGDSYLIKGLTSYSNSDINTIIQTAGTILSWSVVPYCPHPLLKDVGINELIIPTTKDFSKIFNIGTLEFIDDKQQKHIYTGVVTTFYGSLLPLTKLELPLYKLANENQQIFFNHFLYKILIQEINNAETFIEQFKKNIIFNNGVFSDNHDEERDINNFYLTNEPSTLKNNNLEINIVFDDQYKHNLILENIKIRENINFNEFCNEMQDNKNYKNLILLPYFKLFYDEEGGSIYIKDGDYFIYKGYKRKGHKIKFFTKLPTLSNDAIEYEKQAELKRLENKENEQEIKRDEAIYNNPSLFRRGINFLSDKAQIASEFIKKNVPKNIYQGVKRGFSSLVRTGSPIRSLLSASQGALFNQEQENNRINMANTSFENAINQNEFKFEVDININQKMNTLEDLFYYEGNLIMKNKIPTHNNRKYFDYLKCKPIFKTMINANSDIKEKISDLFNLGVYYIHKTIDNNNKNIWIFPYENVENIEVKLISLL